MKEKFKQAIYEISEDIEITENRVNLDNEHKSLIAKCQQIAICSIKGGKEIPAYLIEWAKGGRIEDLNHDFAANNLPKEFSHILIVSFQPGEDKWYLSLLNRDFALMRHFYFVFKGDDDWQQRLTSVSGGEVTLTKLEKTFSPRRLQEEFIDKCRKLEKGIKAELDSQGINKSRQLAREVILQIILLFFLQAGGMLGKNEDFLLKQYQKLTPGDNFFTDYLFPLIKELAREDKKSTKYLGHDLFCVGREAYLLAKKINFTLSNQVLEEVLTGLAEYDYSLRENTLCQQEVIITPGILSDLFEDGLGEVNRRERGVFYTPPEIVSYLCQEGLINYLAAEVEEAPVEEVKKLVYKGRTSSKIKNLAAELDNKLAKIKLCDPAVGSGAFVVGSLQEIVKVRKKLRKFLPTDQSDYQLKLQAVKDSIYGVEINPQAIKITRLRLWLLLAAKADNFAEIERPSLLKYNCVVGNSLLEVEIDIFNSQFNKLQELKERYYSSRDQELRKKMGIKLDKMLAKLTDDSFSFPHYFSEVFSGQKGFDLIICNPPYVGEKGNKELFRKIKEHKVGKFYTGKMDLFYFFFHLGLELSKKSGHLAFITTNYFLRATAAKRLRRDLKERAVIKKMINFKELKLFSAATGQHNLITILRKGEGEVLADTVVTSRRGKVNSKELSYILYAKDSKTNYYSIPQKLLYEGEEDYLRLEIGAIDEILNKVKKEGVNLETICNVNQGIVTGCDRISKRHLKKYDLKMESGQGVFVLEKEEAEKLKLKDKKRWLKPWFKNSDIGVWIPRKKEANRRIIYLDHQVEEVPVKLKSHLKPYRRVLKERREVIKDRIKWWQLQWPREEAIFTGPKLIAPQRSRVNTFAYTDDPWYASADVYYITLKDKRVNLKYLLVLLNSKLYYLWLYKKGKKKGDILELYQRPLTEVPIKVISPEEQEKFIEKAEEIIKVKVKLLELESISWGGLLPEAGEEITLKELARSCDILYKGRAQKVRAIEVKVRGEEVVIYSKKSDGGWYKLIRIKTDNFLLNRYLKYYLENLTKIQLKEINDSSVGIINRVLNIRLPIYNSKIRKEVVNNWSKLQKKINNFQEQVVKIEKEANQLVYDLYGLSKEEIDLVEEKVGELL